MTSPSVQRRPVAVLGATGVVGQRIVQLLAEHPWFRVVELVASERSAGRRYGDVVRWSIEEAMPEMARSIVVKPPDPATIESPLVFSALDATAAEHLERACASDGRIVVSNAKTHRMDDDVPLLIPEVNAGHLALVERQTENRGTPGFIVTNPNCSVIGLTIALAPLHAAAGVRRVIVSTMQAVSGAGYPGVPSLDVADNVIPGIDGEEDKIAQEPQKLLGTIDDGRVRPAEIEISAHTHRVAVTDGHLMAVSLETEAGISPQEAVSSIRDFTGAPQARGLPSAPAEAVTVTDADHRPQPRLDRMRGQGMTVTVGRIRRCPVLGLAFELLAHNTVRGAAGGTILIAELVVASGRLP